MIPTIFANRRELLQRVAWAAPVIAVAMVAPGAAASGPSCAGLPSAVLPSRDGDVQWAQVTATAILVQTTTRGGAIDVTARYADGSQTHTNLITQGKNPGDNQTLYTPGQLVTVPLIACPVWVQVKDVHWQAT